MVIGIAGPSASGKTTIAKLLEERHGAERMRYSEILAELAKERGEDPNDKKVLQDLFVSVRQERGENWLTDLIMEFVQDVKAPHLVIEGNRRKVDIDTLRKVAALRNEPLKFVFIDASPDTRFLRYNLDPKAHGYEPVTREEFEALEKAPTEDEIGYLRDFAKAEGIYINTDNCDVEDTFKMVEEALGL